MAIPFRLRLGLTIAGTAVVAGLVALGSWAWQRRLPQRGADPAGRGGAPEPQQRPRPPADHLHDGIRRVLQLPGATAGAMQARSVRNVQSAQSLQALRQRLG